MCNTTNEPYRRNDEYSLVGIPRHINPFIYNCKYCYASDIVFDYVSGDRICTHCGVVVGTFMYGELTLSDSYKKTYQPRHHFAER